MSISGYSGASTAGESLTFHDGMRFTTRDNDNDVYGAGNCADWVGGGGWWYEDCIWVNLNGLYLSGDYTSPPWGMCWITYKGLAYSMKTTVMKVRPVN